jgi:cytochrome b subunit of formate dehydrogenase
MVMSSRHEFVVPIQPGEGGAQPGGGLWVRRFGRTERFAHWWTVVMLATALLTGLAMGDDGGSGSPLAWMHAGSVVLIGVGLAAALLFGNHRALIRSAPRLFRFDRRDAAWLGGLLRHPADHGREPEWGMFNTGQKMLAWAISASVAAVVLTGVQAWFAHTGEGGLHGAAVAMTAVLLSAHVFMAVVNPATRPALTGMVFGRVPRSWAAEHHGEWLDDVDQSGRSGHDLSPTSGRP